jgi:hypothetical protein
MDVLDVRCGKREERRMMMLVSGIRDRCSGGRLLSQELLSATGGKDQRDRDCVAILK